MFEFTLGLSKHILIANMADTPLIEHQKQQLFQPIRCSQDMSCSLSSGRNIEWPQFPKLRLLRHQNFLSPRLGSACGLALGRGSRGNTPLHLAAAKGHDSVVQRLLQAKAAVDVENEHGRGLGGGYWGANLTRPWDSVVKCIKMLMVHWWFHFLVDIVLFV